MRYSDCCYIGCGQVADFRIRTKYHGMKADDVYMYTDACEQHVGALLGYDPDTTHPELCTWEIEQLIEDRQDIRNPEDQLPYIPGAGEAKDMSETQRG